MPQMNNYWGQTQQPTYASNMYWVQGEAGAKAFAVAPGNTAWLMDSESQTFYIKSVDAMGVPQPLRSFEYNEKTHPVTMTNEPSADYVTRSEFEELKKLIDDLVK